MGSIYDAAANAMQHARIAELWRKRDPDSDPGTLVYCASALIDCSINFRSLKAGLNESEERTFTAWLRPGSTAVDWDVPAIDPVIESELDPMPDQAIRPSDERPLLDEERWSEIESDLVDRLTRRERLVLHYNALFEIFSGVRETLAGFLDRTAEVALQEIEPELKQLKHVYELQLEQVREAHLNRRGAMLADEAGAAAPTSRLEIERMLRGRTEFSETENRITSLFTGLAGLVLQVPDAREQDGEAGIKDGPALDLREDLVRVEREASDALNALYTRYLEMVRSYDDFVIGIQPSNIRVVRRALVWVPVNDEGRGSE